MIYLFYIDCRIIYDKLYILSLQICFKEHLYLKLMILHDHGLRYRMNHLRWFNLDYVIAYPLNNFSKSDYLGYTSVIPNRYCLRF